jgi:hypothetical protein
MKADNVNEIEYSPHLKIVLPLAAGYADDDIVDHEYLVGNILSEVIIRSHYQKSLSEVIIRSHYQKSLLSAWYNYYINNNTKYYFLLKEMYVS